VAIQVEQGTVDKSHSAYPAFPHGVLLASQWVVVASDVDETAIVCNIGIKNSSGTVEHVIFILLLFVNTLDSASS
jgi:hypothetical protein